MKPFWLLLSLPALLPCGSICRGTPPPKPSAFSEKDVLGNWCMGTWSDNEWVITLYPNHTLRATLDGYGAEGPVTTSWRLRGNQLSMDTAPLIKKFGPKTDDQPFSPPLTISRYRNNVVLIPKVNARLIRRHGPNPGICFWHYTIDEKNETQLPAAAKELIKRS